MSALARLIYIINAMWRADGGWTDALIVYDGVCCMCYLSVWHLMAQPEVIIIKTTSRLFTVAWAAAAARAATAAVKF